MNAENYTEITGVLIDFWTEIDSPSDAESEAIGGTDYLVFELEDVHGALHVVPETGFVGYDENVFEQYVENESVVTFKVLNTHL